LFDFLTSDAWQTALANVILLGSISVLPALAVAYVTDRRASRRAGTDFFLGKLEAAEFDRAVFLYAQVSQRIEDVKRSEGAPSSLIKRWSGTTFPPELGQELGELEAYASHLRLTILRLRSTPLRRFKTWVQATSSASALGRGLLIYIAVLGGLIATSLVPSLAEKIDELQLSAELLLWKPFDDRFLFANAAAAALVAIVTPVLYSIRKAQLYRHHEPQFKILKDFAEKEPDQLTQGERLESERSERERLEAPNHEAQAESEAGDAEATTWFALLGVAETATADEIKAAYKERVKQSHPDRVSAMSPAIRALAEAEMKAINSAYQEGLRARGA
jgi:DnaJ-domain-containing protein 1